MSPAHPLDALAVLIADDDEDMRLYLRGCLGALGFIDVREAADGEIALRLAQAPGVALVMSDLLMPGLDGLALCRALKADATTRAIPFLLISGQEHTPSLCADGFLAKPFNTSTLQAQLARLLTLPA